MSSDTPPTPPTRTPLYDEHVAAGARLVDFAGFEMPVRYTSDKEEHNAVRNDVGVFDVSHMSEVMIEGEHAMLLLQRLMSNDVARLAVGEALYTGMLNDEGGFIDDCIVYRLAEQRYLVCTNAGNRAKDTAHMQAVRDSTFPDVTVRDEGDAWVQLAVQGPNARRLVKSLTDADVLDIPAFGFVEATLVAEEKRFTALVARTGYTGEDGFELYTANAHGAALWRALLAGGARPCGLAARDTLRLEAGMCLYGNDIDATTTPYEANIGFTVKVREHAPFIGQAALVQQKAAGVKRRLRGVVMNERGIPRPGYDITDDNGVKIGHVTSGTMAPHVGQAIAMAYLERPFDAPGTVVHVVVRNKAIPATVQKLPFYKRPTD